MILLGKSENIKKVKKSLINLTKAAKSGEENLLELAANAAKKRAPLGEISNALKVAFSRHEAITKTISGA